MKSIILAYISRTLVSNPDLLPQKNGVQPLGSGVLDARSVFKLSVGQQSGLVQVPEALVPRPFETVDALCDNLWTQPHMQEVQG